MKGLKEGTFYRFLWIIIFFAGAGQPAVAQQVVDSFNENGISILNDFKYDSNMVHSYEHLFGLELYIQNKDLKIKNATLISNKHTYDYSPNSNLSIGLGFTYRYLALSAAVNVLPLNNNEALKTKSLDFQSQIAGYRTLSFINAQLYKGFSGDFNKEYDQAGYQATRPDIGFTLLGLNNMYALNKRYSFRGSVLRFQRMKYSVGTPILALDANYWVKSGDSAYVSSGVDPNHFEANMERMRIWNFALGGGYAYTWVPNKRWLFAGIATLKIPVNFVKERLDERFSDRERHWVGSGLNASLWLRGSYEREKWSISLHYIHSKMLVGKEILGNDLSGNYGMARLMFSRRFGISRKFKKTLKPVDAVLDIPFKILGSK
ncbi:MAG: DUF4421 family protein [Taibaiella sp.]|nr:DUF4421 family protein [Taibaiella sp.]